jgi:TRAP-type uncharacterized transport system substrate-binding protein
MASSGTGGVWYPLCGESAGIITNYIPSVEANPEEIAGSVENCMLLAKDRSRNRSFGC